MKNIFVFQFFPTVTKNLKYFTFSHNRQQDNRPRFMFGKNTRYIGYQCAIYLLCICDLVSITVTEKRVLVKRNRIYCVRTINLQQFVCKVNTDDCYRTFGNAYLCRRGADRVLTVISCLFLSITSQVIDWVCSQSLVLYLTKYTLR